MKRLFPKRSALPVSRLQSGIFDSLLIDVSGSITSYLSLKRDNPDTRFSTCRDPKPEAELVTAPWPGRRMYDDPSSGCLYPPRPKSRKPLFERAISNLVAVRCNSDIGGRYDNSASKGFQVEKVGVATCGQIDGGLWPISR